MNTFDSFNGGKTARWRGIVGSIYILTIGGSFAAIFKMFVYLDSLEGCYFLIMNYGYS